MLANLIKSIRRIILKRKLKKAKNFIQVGNSHFFNNFNISISNTIPNKKYLIVGNDSILDCSIVFESHGGQVICGNNNFIGGSTIICRSKVIFEDNIFVAWGGYFYDHDSHSIDYKERQNDIKQQLSDFRNGRNFIENKNWGVVNSKPIKICSNAWIGMNCIILKGVTIGEGAIVGAGSVVAKDVLPWTIVGGNPARLLKEIPEELRRK